MFESNLHIKLHFSIILTFFFTGIFSVITVHAQNIEVVAENGEGIYRLLTRNGLSAAEYMDLLYN
jgi:N-acetylmuramoyl-L-alanine amidase